MSTLYGGEYHARYVHIFFDFCAFYSGCCKVAVKFLFNETKSPIRRCRILLKLKGAFAFITDITLCPSSIWPCHKDIAEYLGSYISFASFSDIDGFAIRTMKNRRWFSTMGT